MNCSRRTMFRGLAGASAIAALGPIGKLVAQNAPTSKRVVVCYFSGGWDVLVGPDARDPAGRYTGLDTGVDLLDAEWQDPLDVRLGSTRGLWGASMRPMLAHRDVTTCFRGVNMNTVAHDTGRSYGNTLLLPSGAAARGSSVGTVFAAGGQTSAVLPFVSIGLSAYNDRFDASANATRLDQPAAVRPMVSGFRQPLPTAIEALVESARSDARSCIGDAYEYADPAAEQELARERMRRLQADGFAARFDFGADTTEMTALRARYGISSPTANDAAVNAATAMTLIKSGLSRAVAVRLTRSLDTHNTNWTEHPERQHEGWSAMATLISDLREDDPNLSNTTVIAFSEFARTPRINGTGGRDHWFASSMVVVGGLRPAFFGATNRDDLGLVRVDPRTGAVSTAASAMQLIPEDIGATIAVSAGLDPTMYRHDPIQSLLP